MGMYDTFRSSYNLGPSFTDVECQTKDIDEYGGTMSFYWLGPDGRLYMPDYDGTHDFEMSKDPGASLWNSFMWVPTGAHGKVRCAYLTKYIEIYPADPKKPWEETPRMHLHFREGLLCDFAQTYPPVVSCEHPFWEDFMAK